MTTTTSKKRKESPEPLLLKKGVRMTSAKLRAALQEYFGFDAFKGNQEAVILNLLAGKDTFVIKPTGGGKSLCYQLPALLSEGVAIIISPLIALMKNQVEDRKSTRLNSSHVSESRMPSSA